MNWDEYFFSLAEAVRQKSKDPSTTVGAIIVGEDHEVISTGFNGFPRGIAEWGEERWLRPIKYEYVVHAEHNAILNAARLGHRLKGSKLYLVGLGPPTLPCTGCAKAIIQAGIVEVAGRAYKPVPSHWEEDFEFARRLLLEAGVHVRECM